VAEAISSRSQSAPWTFHRRWFYGIALVLAVGAALAFRGYWLPVAYELATTGRLPGATDALHGAAGHKEQDEHAGHDHAEHDHAGHDHSHAGHEESNSIELSEQARKNIGLQTAKVELKSFTRAISVPGIVVERPGRSLVQVTAPMTGTVTRIYPLQGEAVSPQQKLFDIHLTHEELVQAQADMLRTIEQLDVIARETARIEKLANEGALPGKTLLERKYEQQKEEAVLRSQKQALLLHGLTPQQVDDIARTRTLLQTLTVSAPAATDQMQPDSCYQVQSLKVAPGQHVTAGDQLAELVDHSELYIEGNAFERDLPEISDAAAAGQTVTALLETEGKQPQLVPDLRILYVASSIDPTSRTLHFYVTLPNRIEYDGRQPDGRRYVSWRYRPGQRTQLRIPVETWHDQLVLPSDAVVQESAEAYVFTANGDHFDRRPVHVQYKDQLWVVLANDGSIFPGDVVAVSGARQLQLALKNKAGGGIDPHAGHNH
jgi:multidrug efflux pump subunit AcrA (membrane-fusion protein)